MPLPLGHTAIGWAAYRTVQPASSDPCGHPNRSRWLQLCFVTILANLPDVDVIYGLVMYGNGDAVHRGPTHSLLFAIAAGFFASRLWRVWHRIPRLGFGLCFGLVFSHVAADMLLTASPVSLFWPLEIYFSDGHNDLSQVLYIVFSRSIQDTGILSFSLIYVFVLRYLRMRRRSFSRRPHLSAIFSFLNTPKP